LCFKVSIKYVNTRSQNAGFSRRNVKVEQQKVIICVKCICFICCFSYSSLNAAINLLTEKTPQSKKAVALKFSSRRLVVFLTAPGRLRPLVVYFRNSLIFCLVIRLSFASGGELGQQKHIISHQSKSSNVIKLL